MSFVQLVIGFLVFGTASGLIAERCKLGSYSPWFIAGGLLPIVAFPLLIIMGLRKESDDNRPKIGALISLGCLVVLGVYVYIEISGFSDDEIASLKNDIRTEYSKQDNIIVKDITLIRETHSKLTGFAVLEVNGVKSSSNCTVRRGSGMDINRVVWQCS